MKNIFTLIFCVVLSTLCYSQEGGKKTEKKNKRIKGPVNRSVDTTRVNTYIVEYDFKKGVYVTNNLKAKVGIPISYKIININRLAYDIKIKSKDSVLSKSYLDNDLDEIIANIKNANNTSAETSAKTTENEIQVPTRNYKDFTLATPVAQKEEVNKILKANDALNIEYGKLSAKKINIENIQKSVDLKIKELQISENKNSVDIGDLEEYKKQIESISDIATKIAEIRDELKKNEERLVEISQSNEILNEFNKSYGELLQLYYALKTHYDNLQIVYQYSNKVSEASANCFLTKEKFEQDYLSDIKVITVQFPALIFEAQEFNNLYTEFDNRFKKINEDKASLPAGTLSDLGNFKFKMSIDNLRTAAEKMNTEMVKLDVKNFVHQLKVMYNLLSDKKNYEFISYPVQPIYDAIVFDVEIKKKSNNKSDIHDERRYSHTEFVRHGLRYDFSVGLGASINSNKYNYDLQFNGAEENVIVKQNKSTFTPSLIGFFTTSYRSASNLTVGVSAGIGVSADEGSFTLDNFYIGPSIVLGRYERIFFTAGVSFRNLPKLNSVYNVGDIVPDNYTLESVTTKSYQAGFFMAFSYNLTKGVKDNIKKASSFF